MTNLERLRIELNNKDYYTDDVYTMYLDENGLDATATYAKTAKKQLLCAVRDILKSLANDLDLFRQVQTEFGTQSQAYQYLSERLNDLDRDILSIPDSTGTKQSMFNFMFHS